MAEGINPSVTSDIWSSKSGHAYMSFTIHYIDSNFCVKYDSLGAVPFTAGASHTAEAIGT